MFIAQFMGENALPVKKGSIANHRGGVGELGENLVNHSVVQKGTIGNTFNKALVNHALDDAAPTTDHFVEQITEEELAKVLGLKPYAGRALSVTCEQDIIQLPQELKSGWEQISAHFDQSGLQHARRVVWNNEFDVALLSEYKDKWMDVFFYGPEAYRVRPNKKRLYMSESMNDKNNFLHLVDSVGVTIPETLFFTSKSEVSDLEQFTYPLVFKINKSVAGLGTKVCKNTSDLLWCLENLRPGVGFHIQKFLGKDAHFISAQYVLDKGYARFVTSSCNFIAGETEHEGNWGGPLFAKKFNVDVDSVCRVIAQEIAHQGGEGWLGIDIGLTADGFMFPIEANLRYTAAAYYYMTACKLEMQDQFWAGRSYGSSKALSELDLGEIAFTPKKGRGWVITNWGPLVEGNGKVQEDGSVKYSCGALYVGPPDIELHRTEEDKLRTFLA
ncbi:MAG: hypothetical protein CR972_00965 [Candidatus Moraniibacteriota bacterium]|nr:MAG: hypothetical protein CR972_00965 [Candidatus Moranbacteria bacterium]